MKHISRLVAIAVLLLPGMVWAACPGGSTCTAINGLPAGGSISGANLTICDQAGVTNACTFAQEAAYVSAVMLAQANTWTAVQTFTNSDVRLLGSSTGYTTFTSANAGATNYTLTVPANTGTVGELNLAQTWSALQTFGTNISIAGVTVTGATGTGNNVFATSPTLTSPTFATSATLSYITGATQCLHVNTSGAISGTGADCGSGSSGLTVGSTTIASGTNGDIEYNNSGVLGELATTGSGNVVRATSPTLVTPALGTPSALVCTNCSGTAASLTAGTATLAGTANALNSSSGSVNVSAATAPTIGEVLTATSSTTATWQTPSASATSITPGTTTVVGATAPCLIDNSTSTTMGCAATNSTVLADIAANTTFTITPTGCTPSAHAGVPFAGTITLASGPCTSIVITMNGATGFTAPNGFHCNVQDKTLQAAGTWFGEWGETSSNTTTATIAIPSAAGATDVISFDCEYY